MAVIERCPMCEQPLSAEGRARALAVAMKMRAEANAETIGSLQRQLRGAVSLEVARDALTDALADYNVPTGQIIAEFERLAAEYGGQ
jgi:hypothetical protein